MDETAAGSMEELNLFYFFFWLKLNLLNAIYSPLLLHPSILLGKDYHTSDGLLKITRVSLVSLHGAGEERCVSINK